MENIKDAVWQSRLENQHTIDILTFYAIRSKIFKDTLKIATVTQLKSALFRIEQRTVLYSKKGRVENINKQLRNYKEK